MNQMSVKIAMLKLPGSKSEPKNGMPISLLLLVPNIIEKPIHYQWRY